MPPTLPADDNKPRQAPLLLVVDDLEANLEAMRALLGDDERWQLRCANSGEAALRCLLQEDVALVLLDVHMPGMDGYEVAELMRGNPRTRDTPIIFRIGHCANPGCRPTRLRSWRDGLHPETL